MKRNRVYTDTSVFGGIEDDEFRVVSLMFFDEVIRGKDSLIVSEITALELSDAPGVIRQFAASLPREFIERVPFTGEMADLRDAYLTAGIIGPRWTDDAAHVVATTVSRCDVIVSWNFKHLVQWEKIRGYNSVNLSLGYPLMTILSPRELVSNEEEDF